jgi:hypothetical protein
VSGNHCTTGNRDAFLDSLGAKLTEAAYPVMLQHGVVDSWLDLELDLWKALKETVKKWDQEWPSASVMLVSTPQSRNPQDESG